MSKKLYIIDGHALVYRSHFAFINNPLINSKGENTSAVFGFASTILRIIKEEQPDYLLIAFDSKEPTFRHNIYDAYKATREKMPEDLIAQLDRIAQVVETLEIKSIDKPGYEADDIIGTVAKKCGAEGLDVYMVTGDKDLMQLVDDNITWVNLRRTNNETEMLDSKGVKEKFGVPPDGVIEVLALMGDSSDNVPGVAGVGKVTAVKLVNEYGTVENLYENIEKITQKKLNEKLVTDKENAILSKELVTIDCSIPIELDTESLALPHPDAKAVRELFTELEFTSLIDSIPEKVEEVERTTDYKVVNSKSELDALAGNLQKNAFVFDLETTGLDAVDAEIVGFSFAWKENEAYYVPVVAPDATINLALDDIISTLKPILENPDIKKCGQNIKYDMKVLYKYDIKTRGVTFDTMLAAHMIDPDKRHVDLDSLSLEHLNIKKIPTSQLIGKGKDEINMRDVPLEEITEYACEDADCTFQLWKKLEPEVKNKNVWKLFTEIEIPIISVMTEVELTGIKLDTDFLGIMSNKLHKMLGELKAKIYDFAGSEFNIDSPKQLGEILFDTLEIHKDLGIKRVKKTKTGAYQTNVTVLEQYKGHPMVDTILEYRMVAKLISTYVDALPLMVNKKTGRVHSTFNQTIAATGRLSSTDPNLQNIPIRTETGREIRKAFIPGYDGWKLIAADYSQIELRIMAHLSGDKNMQSAFRNGEDIHAATAANINGVALEEVTKQMRYQAKAINFGILYGMSSYKLARETGTSNQEAQDFINAYFAFFPEVNNFIASQIANARKDGYAITMFGRKRYLPEIHSDNQRIRNHAENIAINAPLQGTAAEIIKIAMIALHKKLMQEKIEANMLLQIHDELVFETPEEKVSSLQELVKEVMENTVSLDVPLVVDVHSGNNWFEA